MGSGDARTPGGVHRERMRTSHALLAAAAVALWSCGDSNPAPAPTQATPPTDPNAVPTVVMPSPEQPSPTPPAPQPPAPPPPSQPDRFVDVERLDANAECDALVPASVPTPVTAKVTNPRGPTCLGGTSEGGGHVAVVDGLAAPNDEWLSFTPDGTPRQRFRLFGGASAPQPDGWLGVQAGSSHGPMSVSFASFFGDGSPRLSESISNIGGFAFGADPQGGALFLVVPFDPASTTTCTAQARRYDATGALRGPPGRTACAFAVGVSTTGDGLGIELTRGGRVVLHWIRPDGTPARPPSDDGAFADVLGTTFDLAPLLDGSLAARTAPGWTRRYPDLAARGEPAPAWLAAHGRERFRFTRGNKGYAFFPAPGQASADCRQAIELVAPSGRRCVRLTFREPDTGCTTGAIDQGWDGTVVQQSAKDPCAYRWWPGLLGD